MGVNRRLLPVQVQPLEGEALDSWLEATALAMGGTLGSVAAAANLPTAAGPPWRRCLSSDQLHSLMAETGVSGETLEAMTLSRYDGRALRLHSRTRRLDPDFPFGALSWSRFCPACLRETRGRWQLIWFLTWSFACLKHNCLLVDHCPECRVHQRSTLQYRRVPTPTVCKCGCPLDLAPTVQLLVDDHSFLWSQRLINNVIGKGHIGFGVFGTHPRPHNEVLVAVRSLANRALTFAAEQGLSVGKVFDESTGRGSVDLIPAESRKTLNNRAPQHAMEMAVGVTIAMRVLTQPSITEAGEHARSFLEGQNAITGPAELRSCPKDSDVAVAVVLKARTADLSLDQQLRYRVTSPAPCLPNADPNRVRVMAAMLPTALWTEWAARLQPDGDPTVETRETLSFAALIVGRAVTPDAAVRLLGGSGDASAVRRKLRKISDAVRKQVICRALCQLNDYLEESGSFIDYERRRRLDYTALLPVEAWHRESEEHGGVFPPGLSATAARCYLIERMSGSPVLALASHPELGNRSLQTFVAAFKVNLTESMVTTLDSLAEGFLRQQGIDEPAYWHPPIGVICTG